MRIFLAVAIVLLCVSTLDASSIYRKAESNAATDLVRRDQISQNKQANQYGRNIANQDQALNGYGRQIEQIQKNNLEGDNISNQVQSIDEGKQTLRDKQLNQNGRNVENQAMLNEYGKNQIEKSQQNNLYDGNNVSNQVQEQGPFEKNINAGDNTQFNAAMKSDAYYNPNIARVGDNNQFDPINQNGLYNNAAQTQKLGTTNKLGSDNTLNQLQYDSDVIDGKPYSAAKNN